MGRGVEGHHLAAFFEQEGKVVFEKADIGFPAMRDQDLPDRGFCRQPDTAAYSVSIMVKRQPVAFPVQVRSFSGRPLLWSGEEAKSHENGFAGRGQ